MDSYYYDYSNDYNYDYNFDNNYDTQPIWGSEYFPPISSYQIDPPPPPPPADEEAIVLASSCPKKRAGRKKFKETRHPVYRGIRMRHKSKWVCELRTTSNDKCKQQQCPSRIWLGTYPTAEMAARAHDVAALALRGRNACLNFADSASILRVPTSGDITDIRQAAAEAAELFHPPNEWSTGENSTLQEQTTEDEQEGFSSSEEKDKADATAAEEDHELVQETNNNAGSVAYMDETAELTATTSFDMQTMLARMSEGTLLSPPHHHQYHGGNDTPWGGYGWDDQMDSNDNGTDLPLWSWS